MNKNKRKGLLSFLRRNSPPEPDNYPERFYYEQIAAIVGAGGWTIDFTEKKAISINSCALFLTLPQPINHHLRILLVFIMRTITSS